MKMACGGCNTSNGLNKDQILNLINDLIDAGKIQSGLKSCGGDDLTKGDKVVLCDTLASAINQLIKDGAISLVKDIQLKGGNLVVIDGEGNEKEIPYLSGVASDDGAVITLPNGSTVELIGKDKALTKDMFGNTIKQSKLVEGKFDVDLDAIAGKGVKVNQETNKLDLDLNNVVSAGSGLTLNNGSLKVNPKDFVDNSSIVFDPATGRIKVANKPPIKVTDLNDIRGLGTTYFSGYVCNTDGSTVFVKGVPVDVLPNRNKAVSTPQALTFDELKPGQCYDFNGWQIASENEVSQYFQEGEKVWIRTQDAGMNADGTHKGNVWSEWKRADNIDSAQQDGFIALQNRLASIERQLSEPCTANVKTLTSNYTPTKTDEMLIFSGGQTVTFGGDVPVGKQWTIINDSDNAITLASGVEIIPPYKGSLKVKGKNAVVTVVKTSANQFRVFGQTEA